MKSTTISPDHLERTVWIAVCHLHELAPERGVAALVHGNQGALVRAHDDRVFAVQQRDPYSGSMVLSRGIVGSRGERPTLTSPMFKQVFDLTTGSCLDPVGKEPITLRTWPIRLDDGVVSIGLGDEARS